MINKMTPDERFEYYIKNWTVKQTVLVPEHCKLCKRNRLFYYQGSDVKDEDVPGFPFLYGVLRPGLWWDQGPDFSLNIKCLGITEDGVDNENLPALSKVRRISDEFGSILVPQEYVRHWGEIKNLPSNDIPWKEKIPSCVWRGTPSGMNQNCDPDPEKWENPRMMFCHLYKEKYNVGLGQNLEDRWPTDYIKGPLSIREMLEYKYIISISGNDKDSGLNWKLASNSLVMMATPWVESWLMEGLLKPYVHYIPLQEDYRDLEEKLDWCHHHDEECKKIVKNANEFMSQFTDFETEKRLFDRIKQYYLDTFTLIVD